MFLKDHFISQKQRKKLKIFYALLLKHNKQINLFLENLFQESLLTGTLLKEFFKKNSSVLDIGSGNGFPAIVLACLYPKSFFILCERNQKKSEFLNQVKFRLNLTKVQVLCKDAEKLNQTFPLVLSKATGPFKKVLRILEKTLHKKGCAFLWKSSSWKGQEEGFFLKTKFIVRVFKTYDRPLSSTQGLLVKLKFSNKGLEKSSFIASK